MFQVYVPSLCSKFMKIFADVVHDVFHVLRCVGVLPHTRSKLECVVRTVLEKERICIRNIFRKRDFKDIRCYLGPASEEKNTI